MGKNLLSVLGGFLLLFAVYHFPEFYNELWIAAVFKIGFLFVSFFVARWQGLKGLAGFGLGLHKGWYANLLKGLLIGAVFFALSVLLSVILGYDQLTTVAPLADILKQLPLVLLMTVFPSVAEDILTRGYLYAHSKERMNMRVFILFSSSVYVLNHIWRLGDHPSVLIYLFILGLALAYALWQTRSLWLAFGIHWGSNIAYEHNASFIKTETVRGNHAGTWLLGLSFLLMLFFLLMVLKSKGTPGTSN